MYLKPDKDNLGRLVWLALTDDDEYDGVGGNPLDAITRLVEELESVLKNKIIIDRDK